MGIVVLLLAVAAVGLFLWPVTSALADEVAEWAGVVDWHGPLTEDAPELAAAWAVDRFLAELRGLTVVLEHIRDASDSASTRMVDFRVAWNAPMRGGNGSQGSMRWRSTRYVPGPQP